MGVQLEQKLQNIQVELRTPGIYPKYSCRDNYMHVEVMIYEWRSEEEALADLHWLYHGVPNLTLFCFKRKNVCEIFLLPIRNVCGVGELRAYSFLLSFDRF
jgi:hypothetical protein